ncbi:MAG: hypothetical protein OXFUSZZB_000598 [Candidatus Fervidibacter sp.]|jgi:hypothetical protein
MRLTVLDESIDDDYYYLIAVRAIERLLMAGVAIPN